MGQYIEVGVQSGILTGNRYLHQVPGCPCLTMGALKCNLKGPHLFITCLVYLFVLEGIAVATVHPLCAFRISNTPPEMAIAQKQMK
jgi:hypothetical protein